MLSGNNWYLVGPLSLMRHASHQREQSHTYMHGGLALANKFWIGDHGVYLTHRSIRQLSSIHTYYILDRIQQSGVSVDVRTYVRELSGAPGMHHGRLGDLPRLSPQLLPRPPRPAAAGDGTRPRRRQGLRILALGGHHLPTIPRLGALSGKHG